MHWLNIASFRTAKQSKEACFFLRWWLCHGCLATLMFVFPRSTLGWTVTLLKQVIRTYCLPRTLFCRIIVGFIVASLCSLSKQRRLDDFRFLELRDAFVVRALWLSVAFAARSCVQPGLL